MLAAARIGSRSSFLRPRISSRLALLSTDTDEKRPSAPSEKTSWLESKLGRKAIEASDGYNRWLASVPLFAVSGSIGGVYSWSIFNGPLTREIGVIGSASADWALGDVLTTFSVAAVAMGSGAFFGGPWVDRVGPRYSSLVAAVCWSGGLAVSSIGCATHQLPLIYLGYGAVAGCGWGLGYILPIKTLLAWFPDKRGLATGLGVAAFGSGGVVGTCAQSPAQ